MKAPRTVLLASLLPLAALLLVAVPTSLLLMTLTLSKKLSRDVQMSLNRLGNGSSQDRYND